MNGIGDVLRGDWRSRQNDQSNRRKPDSEDECDVSEETLGWDDASDSIVANPVPQYTASMSEAVSMLQVAVQHAETVQVVLSKFNSHLEEAGRGRVAANTVQTLYQEAQTAIDAIQEMERRFYACRCAIRPEFAITFDYQPVPVQQLAALAMAWEDSGKPKCDWIKTTQMSVYESLEAVLGYQSRARRWLQQLTNLAEAIWTAQEEAFGIEHTHGNPGHCAPKMTQLAKKLLREGSPEPCLLWGELLPKQVASLLSNPRV